MIGNASKHSGFCHAKQLMAIAVPLSAIKSISYETFRRINCAKFV
jgi:hypothetical protein